MEREQIAIDSEFIKLDSFLKFAGLAQTGGQAKDAIQAGAVLVQPARCAPCGAKSSAPGTSSPPRIFPSWNSRSSPVRINSLSLEQYRNIARCEIRPGEGVNLIVGDNGMGKTSMMEAIWLLTGARSFRSGRESDFIRWELDRETQRSRVAAGCGPRAGSRSWNISCGPAVRPGSTALPNRGAVPFPASCAVWCFRPPTWLWWRAARLSAGTFWTVPSASCAPSTARCSAITTGHWPSGAPCCGRPPGTAASWTCCRCSITTLPGWAA